MYVSYDHAAAGAKMWQDGRIQEFSITAYHTQTTRRQGKSKAECRGVESDLDEFSCLRSLLEGAAHLVRGEVEGGVARSDVLLDRLDARAVALLESLDGFENHLPR